jgi:predicted ATPase/DNA-binding winged helix-turn-helix (wHTH) protein
MNLSFGVYTLRAHERELIGPNGPVALSARSFDILLAFLDRPAALIGKSDLLDIVWPGVAVEENTLHVHMSALRKALGPGFIATVHGRGYRYVGPPPLEDVGSELPFPPRSGGNLHRYRVDCVAREAETAAVIELLGHHRLVSILGAGGVGKTTLALNVASKIAAGFAGGVWVIDLAPLSDGSLVESAVIQTMGIPFRARSTPLKSILDVIGHQDLLVVFDNCEHVDLAVARLAKPLLADAPGLRILTTTQVPLAIAAGHVYKLSPFGLPETSQDSGHDIAVEVPSAQFLAYCYEALGEKLTDSELPIVARLCRRLDGVALAIKMAAARAATLGIETVDRQIAEHLAGLEAQWEPSLPRHRSLMASLGWSYDLLSEPDRKTLRHLGVFQGSFTLEGISALVGAAANDSLSELVRRSLVVRDTSDRSRYRLLETTRQFALERLREADEEAAARTRHAGYVLALFSAGLERWDTLPDRDWLSSHQPDGDNLRSALDWTRTRSDWAIHVALAANSYRFWIQSQLPAEGMQACEAAMSLVEEVKPEIAGLLRLAFAELARFYRQDIRLREALKPAIAYFGQTGDQSRLAQALILEATALTVQKRKQEASAIFKQLDAMSMQMPPSKLKARALVGAGMSIWEEGDKLVGRAKLEAGLAMHVAMGNQRGFFKSTMYSAEIMHWNGDNEEAIALVTGIMEELRSAGTQQEIGDQLGNLAAYWLSAGNHQVARSLVAEAVAVMPRDDGNNYWCLLQNAAELAIIEGSLETAALLLGFVDQRFKAWADGRQATEIMQRKRMVERLEQGLSASELKRLGERGASLSAFEADLLAGFQ